MFSPPPFCTIIFLAFLLQVFLTLPLLTFLPRIVAHALFLFAHGPYKAMPWLCDNLLCGFCVFVLFFGPFCNVDIFCFSYCCLCSCFVWLLWFFRAPFRARAFLASSWHQDFMSITLSSPDSRPFTFVPALYVYLFLARFSRVLSVSVSAHPRPFVTVLVFFSCPLAPIHSFAPSHTHP